MEPKEKAIELFNNMHLHNDGCDGLTGYDPDIHNENAKQCALICVAEILNSNPHKYINDEYDWNSGIEYWQEVKKQIEEL